MASAAILLLLARPKLIKTSAVTSGFADVFNAILTFILLMMADGDDDCNFIKYASRNQANKELSEATL